MAKPRNDRPKKSVLVVDDDALMRKLISALLERFGYRVTLARDGAEALEEVSRHSFDCVLMDVDMPRMTGLEATRAIRRLSSAAHRVPIVAVTARISPDDVRECRTAGMDNHCSKPVKPFDLARIVHETLTHSQHPYSGERLLAQ